MCGLWITPVIQALMNVHSVVLSTMLVMNGNLIPVKLADAIILMIVRFPFNLSSTDAHFHITINQITIQRQNVKSSVFRTKRNFSKVINYSLGSLFVLNETNASWATPFLSSCEHICIFYFYILANTVNQGIQLEIFGPLNQFPWPIQFLDVRFFTYKNRSLF